MRIRVTHRTIYDYSQPARAIMQLLRLTPRPHDGQHILRWRIDADADVRLIAGNDRFGNVTHMLVVERSVDRLTIDVRGEAETADTKGILTGCEERLPPELFLRSTALTQPDPAISAFAYDVAGSGADPLTALHALLTAIHREIVFDTDPTHSGTTAAQALAHGRGVCQDMAHIFIACARRLGVPARYVSGHLARSDGLTDQAASHAWAEAHVSGLGWVGFDPANGISPTDAYLRVATGLDYLDAAPVRGSRIGGGDERLTVQLRVLDAARQMQA